MYPENLKSAKRMVYNMAEHSGPRTQNWKTAYTETFYEGVPAEDVRRVIQYENEEFKLPKSKFAEIAI